MMLRDNKLEKLLPIWKYHYFFFKQKTKLPNIDIRHVNGSQSAVHAYANWQLIYRLSYRICNRTK